MSRRKVLISLFISVLAVSAVSVVADLQRQNKATAPHNYPQLENKNQCPIVDYNDPEPTDPTERSKRKVKGKKYNRPFAAIAEGVETSEVYHWPVGFPALPVAQSDVIVVGKVSGARAFLSEDKTGVYSEFNIKITQILKNDNQAPLATGGLVVAERPSGRVRYPSGAVGKLSIAGFGMPCVGYQYVLFLTRTNQQHSYSILTGYELRQGRVFPLDKSTSSDTNFDVYANSDEATFLNRIKAGIASSLNVIPQ